jgi:hypothetical protein
MIAKAAILGLALAAISAASPVSHPTRSIAKRWEEGVDCTSDIVTNGNTPGLFFAVDSSGINVYCEDIADVSSDQ